MAELVWHRLFGVEVDFAALVAPTHLAVAVGFGLIVSGPLRAAIARAAHFPSFVSLLPGTCSLALVMALIDFFTQWTLRPDRGYALGPTSVFWGRLDPQPLAVMTDLQYVLGVDDVLVHGLLLAGVVIFLRRIFPPVRGLASIVLMLGGLPVLAIRTLPEHGEVFLPTAVALAVAAVGAELWPRRIRMTAALVPGAYYLVYFSWVVYAQQICWSVHVIAGSVVAVSVAGWLASFLAFPPDSVAERSAA